MAKGEFNNGTFILGTKIHEIIVIQKKLVDFPVTWNQQKEIQVDSFCLAMHSYDYRKARRSNFRNILTFPS